MNEHLLNALIQLGISLAGAGFLVQLLMLRQNRRKVAGDASASEANAASTLSGAAIKMVENAQAKEVEASQRADRLEDRLTQVRAESDARREADAQELEDRAWTIHHLQMRNAILENALRQVGVDIPPEPEYDEQHFRRLRAPEIDTSRRPLEVVWEEGDPDDYV